ncbi:uncharacterized protein [Ptychodera flava]|uniref:uncharacterized protein n=1 Tax=Ptychodera flava TaxID=63121 RepID=UPI00396A7512
MMILLIFGMMMLRCIQYDHSCSANGGNLSAETGRSSSCEPVNVNVPENKDIGSILHTFPVEEDGKTELILTGDNMEERFGFHNNDGTLFLARHLDYKVRNFYSLMLHIKGQTNSSDAPICPYHNITITVDDVVDWPPYFNETCSWQEGNDAKYGEFVSYSIRS